MSLVRSLWYHASFLLAVAALAGAGCTSTADLPSGNAKTLALGAVVPLTGPHALLGQSMRRGLELGVEDVNAAGGAAGRTVTLGVLDSQSDLTEGAKAVAKFTDRNVPVLLLAEPSLAAFMADGLAGRPQLIGFMSDYVTVPSATPKNGVRIFLNGDQEGKLITAYLAASGINKVAILHHGDLIGQSHAQYMEFLLHGEYLTTYKDAYSPTERNFGPLAEIMQRVKADAIVLVGYGPEYPSVMASFEMAGWKGLVLGYLGQDSLAGLSNQHGLAGSAIYPAPAFLTNPTGTDAGRAFVERFRAKYGSEPDLPAAYAYDNVRALAASATLAASVQPQKIRQGFLSMGHYTGAVGTYSIHPDGDTEMPLQLVTGDGQPPPPPPKNAKVPELINVPGTVEPLHIYPDYTPPPDAAPKPGSPGSANAGPSAASKPGAPTAPAQPKP